MQDKNGVAQSIEEATEACIFQGKLLWCVRERERQILSFLSTL